MEAGKKRHWRMLIIIGILMLVICFVSLKVNEDQIYERYMTLGMENFRQQAQRITEHARSQMEEYDAMPWLFRYWRVHGADMDVPIGGLDDPAWLARHASTAEMNNMDVTEEEAEAMSPEGQKEFAEICYLQFAESFDQIFMDFDMEALYCNVYQGDGLAYVFFSAYELGTEGSCPLGELRHMNLDSHPVAKKIYETGRQVPELEQYTSTDDDREYLTYIEPITVNGEIYALISSQFLWNEVHEGISRSAREVSTSSFVRLLILLVVCTAILYWIVFQPILRIQKNVRIYKDRKNSLEVQGDLEKIAKVPTEIGELAWNVSGMMQAMDQYVEDVRTATAEKERLSTELELAAQIQAGVLPSVSVFTDRQDFVLSASMTPAKEVGGDFYDFFMVDEDHLCLTIADVSGKGVPAALFMMISKTILSQHVMMGKSPAEALEAANLALIQSNKQDMFVTVWLGILELSTGRLIAANAGHEYPMIAEPGKPFKVFNDRHSLALGCMEWMKCFEYTLSLKPGTRLFVYTDGVPEATNTEGEMLGMARMEKALNSDEMASPEELLKNVWRGVNDFVKDAEQFDDLTMLCVEYRGSTPA